jgi:hypothetical protein
VRNTYYDDTDSANPKISTAGMALLLGVPLDILRAEIDRQEGPAFQIPPLWLRQGKRIARETMAATGSESMKDAIDYLAARRAQS